MESQPEIIQEAAPPPKEIKNSNVSYDGQNKEYAWTTFDDVLDHLEQKQKEGPVSDVSLPDDFDLEKDDPLYRANPESKPPEVKISDISAIANHVANASQGNNIREIDLSGQFGVHMLSYMKGTSQHQAREREEALKNNEAALDYQREMQWARVDALGENDVNDLMDIPDRITPRGLLLG